MIQEKIICMPVIITEKRKQALVLIPPEEFIRRNKCSWFMQGMGDGLADAEAGLVAEHED